MKKLLIHPEELSKRWVDRLADQGVDILRLHPVGGNGAAASAARLMEQVEDPEFRRLIDYAHSRGLQVEYELHAASYLLPRALFESRPELFRMEKGQRVSLVNFCATNAEARQILCENAVKFAKKLYGSRPYYYFWLDDTRALRCQCPGCSTMSTSDLQLLVMNDVVAALRAEIPAAKLAHLAYHGTEPAPQTVKPAEGIFLEFAPMNRDFTLPADRVSQESKDNMAALLQYFGREDATVLEYWYDNSMFSQWKKPPKAFAPRNDLITQDLAWYKNLGFAHIASFACYLGQEYEDLHGEPDISAF